MNAAVHGDQLIQRTIKKVLPSLSFSNVSAMVLTRLDVGEAAASAAPAPALAPATAAASAAADVAAAASAESGMSLNDASWTRNSGKEEK